jgi:hypothetical protein
MPDGERRKPIDIEYIGQSSRSQLLKIEQKFDKNEMLDLNFLNFEPQELIKSVTHQRCESRVANIWMDNAFDLQTSISIGFLLSPSGMCVPSFI